MDERKGHDARYAAEPQRSQLLWYELFLLADGHGDECLPHAGIYDFHAGTEGESPYQEGCAVNARHPHYPKVWIMWIIKSNLKSICKSQVSVLQILGFLKFGL